MNLFHFISRIVVWVKKRIHQLSLSRYLKQTRDEYDFQPGYLEIMERPPSPWSRGIALGLTATLLIVLLWAIIGKLDIQANATGEILVSSHSKVIQPLDIGEITAINVQNGQRVKSGDILVRLNPVSVKAELKQQQEQLQQISSNDEYE